VAEKTQVTAQKTKDKAKSWGLKGIGFLSKAVSVGMLQCVAACCSVLQCDAVCCRKLQEVGG